MKQGETPKDTAQRAFTEELGISREIPVLFAGSKEEVEQESPSYPGLTSRYTIYIASAFIPDEDFRPEGYIERTDRLTSYFTWERLEVA